MIKKKVKETFTQSIFALMCSQVIVKVLGLIYRLYLTNRSGYGDEGNAIASAGLICPPVPAADMTIFINIPELSYFKFELLEIFNNTPTESKLTIIAVPP